MAVAPTGAIYKALEFDGVSSRTYGVYITGEAVYNAPERDVEMITIPGRSGSFALDNGRFENITVTYPAGIFAETEADFRDAISEFRNFLCSRKGYVRLQDEYNPNEYRMAVYKSGLEVEPAMLKAGEFEITFDCKPQRWLTSGEEAVTIGEWGETETATGDIVTVENEDGILGVKSLSVDLQPIQDLHGYDKPWSGGAGKNKFNGADVTTTHSSNWEIGWNENTNALTITHKTSYTTGVPSCSLNLPSGTYVSSFASQTKNGSISLYTNGSYTKILSDGTTFDIASGNTYEIRITADEGTPNVVTKFQIESGSTATSWTPYSNICPIIGWDECNVGVSGKNLLQNNPWYNFTYNASVGNTLDTSTSVPSWTTSDNETYTTTLTDWQRSGWLSAKLPQGTTVTSSVLFVSGNPRVTSYILDENFKITRSFGLANPIRDNTQYGHTITLTNNECYFAIAILGSNKTTVINKPIIEIGSTATTYEPYNGATYTTALGRTVYGGTLDVVSGELVVDRAMVDLGTLTWSKFLALSNPDVYIWGTTSLPSHLSSAPICSAFEGVAQVTSNTGAYYKGNGKCCFLSAGDRRLYVRVDGHEDDTASQFKAFVSGVQLCYELATPTTYQLTPTEVALLLGNNNVWSEDGEVTVEYGQLPNLLINPTLFEASPLLEVEGDGSIEFNGYKITINDVPLGEIETSGKSTDTIAPYLTFSDLPLSYSKQIDYSAFRDAIENGDSLFIDSLKITAISTFGYSKEMRTIPGASPSPTITSNIGTASASGAVSNVQKSFLHQNYYDINFTINASIRDIELTAFTDEQYTANITAVLKDTSNNTLRTLDITVNIDNYNSGILEIALSFSGTNNIGNGFDFYNGGSIEYSRTYIYSTQSVLGNPLYLDCDLGEAYKIEGGTVISINQHVDLGSKLPTLAPGSNAITFDNTITDLKVTPRWWRV